jgi:alpha-ketoglutarate-dependent taurine dioxygenase
MGSRNHNVYAYGLIHCRKKLHFTTRICSVDSTISFHHQQLNLRYERQSLVVWNSFKNRLLRFKSCDRRNRFSPCRAVCISTSTPVDVPSRFMDEKNQCSNFAADIVTSRTAPHTNQVQLSYSIVTDSLKMITTIFHAPWLWSNDPTNIHASSGQRTCTSAIVSYFSDLVQIHSVEIVYVNTSDDQILDKDYNPDIIQPVKPSPPPPPGSLHPIGGIYSNDDSDQGTINIVDVEPQQALLHVTWETTKGFKHSYYDVSWLIRCRYDANSIQSRAVFSKNICNETEMIDSNKVLFQTYSYGDMFTQTGMANYSDVSTTNCFRLLHSIFNYGAALVRHVPNPNPHCSDIASDDDDSTRPVAILGKILSGGQLSHGQLYGDVFHVQDKAAVTATQSNGHQTLANNVAYTSMALCPHQDLAYYESIPGLQLLHCVDNDPDVVRGGESVLIDVLAAAYEFRRLAPSLFEILVTCEATFVKQRHGADMVYRRPHIQVASSLSGTITSVRWSPPFEGPLFVPSNLVEDYYVAYSAFERMLDNSLPRCTTTCDRHSDNSHNRLLPRISSSLESDLCDYANTFTWEYRLRCDEMLIFNNQRMLHGRRAYSIVHSSSTSSVGRRYDSTRGRHLMGCYTNIDDTLNQYRILRRQFYRTQYHLPYSRNVGNGGSDML